MNRGCECEGGGGYKGTTLVDSRVQERQSLNGWVVKYTAAQPLYHLDLLTSLLEALAELHLQELELPFNYC